ncbi:MAG: LapA family protein [Actinobacteria bacterium]|nr:LapA family protein [Actinomycetota bacterium]
MNPKAVIVLVPAVLLLVVIVQNTEAVRLRLLFWELDTSLVIVLVLTAVLAFATGFLTSWIMASNKRRAAKAARR